ncbi:hypothetical protein SAMN05661091_0933 [Paenibacillus uliginis N3/975]|uniref:Uncharacterized protein n=1 Tax=Paenibacillus uliginis N3/975 TaxID=1313296 RepID=A0A1X7GQ95_9BACL|nr:hypothetical protein [Paenibacillus uliginis]SMF73121.1 hypothetical protein SAMN05661091_0933 [Paenibacillus uliginis N3/975]
MFLLILDVLIISLNVLIILFGMYVFIYPDNDWLRMFNGIPDDVEQDDIDLLKIKFRAVIAIMLGVIMGSFSVLQAIVTHIG